MALFFMLIGMAFIPGLMKFANMRQTKVKPIEPTPRLIPYWEWYPMMNKAVEALTIDTIELFDSLQLPMFAEEKKSPNWTGVRTANEIRSSYIPLQYEPPVYLYEKYEDDYASVEIDQLLDSVRIFKTASRGVGRRIAVRIGQPHYDILTDITSSIWKCTEHDNIQMKFQETREMPLEMSSLSKKFQCSECEAERINPQLKLDRMGVKVISPKVVFDGVFLTKDYDDTEEII